MRKEVKLGMGLGGGLVALLVAYLIVAPPSDKHGTQLVTGEGGSIIDPPNAAGGDGAAAPLPDDGTGAAPTAAAPSEPAKAEVPAAHPVEQPRAAETKAVAKVEAKASGSATSRDPWNHVLNEPTAKESGKSTKAHPGQVASNPPAPSPAPMTEHKESVKVGEHKAAPAEKREIRLAASEGGVAPEARSDARLYYANPNDAWGGGLSTDAAAAELDRSMKKAGVPKAGPVAATPLAPESAVTSELGSTSAAPKAGATHVVRSGETFSSIAQAVYGSAAYYPHLIRANPHANPNNLKLGTVINIPKVEDVKATGGPVSSSAAEHSKGAALTVVDEVKIDPTKQYRVQPGDSLYKISQKVYGKPTYVEAIYEKNRQQIGANPTKLKLGMILELPEKVAGGQPEAALGGGTSGAN
jgi:nucleoid-associated protein YgaU